MRITIKKSISIVLTILMAASLFVTPAFAAGVKKAEQPGDVTVQEEDYRAWEQDDPRWGSEPLGHSTMARIGCYVTAITKTIIQAGFAIPGHNGSNPAELDPGIFCRLCRENGWVNDDGDMRPRQAFEEYTNNGLEYDYENAPGTYRAVKDKVLGYLDQGLYVIVKVRKENGSGPHYIGVDRPTSIANRDVYIMDSAHSGFGPMVDVTLNDKYYSNGYNAYLIITVAVKTTPPYADPSNPPATPAPTPEPTPEPTPVPKYAVTFKDGLDGSTIDVQQVTEGGAAVAPPPPTHTGYHFTGWDKNFNNITAPLTVTALYAINTYTVKWKNWNGDTLETDSSVPYNTMPEYNGETPKREATAQYTYTFSGWEPEIVPVTDNAVYTAQYDSALNKYTVTFYDHDNTILQQGEVYYGETPVPPPNPNNKEGWHFVCWSPEIVSVTGDAEYYAQYAINEYDIIFNEYIYDSYDEYYGYEGYWDVFDTQTVEHGSAPYDPGEPDDYYGHHFVGWEPEVDPIEGDYDGQEFVFDAQYEINTYYVYFIDSLTGEYLCNTQVIHHGDCVDVPDYLEYEGYVFNCWTRDYSDTPVDPAAPVMGNYHEQQIYFYARYDIEITFCDWNGVPFDIELIPYDYYSYYIDDPAAPEHNGYTFTSWSPEFENPHYYDEGPKTYIAQYEFNHPEDPDIIFRTNTVYTEPGETVTIDFTVEALRPYECHAFTGFLYYEPSELTLVNNELIKGEVWQQIGALGGMVAVDTSVPGKIGLTVIMPNAGFNMSGIIFSMDFHVEKYHDWQGYSSPLFIEIAECSNHPVGGAGTPIVYDIEKYSLQGITQGNGLTGGVPPVRFSM